MFLSRLTGDPIGFTAGGLFVIYRKSVLTVSIKNKLELCAFALKGEHNVYSLVPNIAVCMYIYIYIDQK